MSRKLINLKPKEKIWGTTICIHEDDTSSTNILRIKKGGVCSYHYHEEKNNTFYVLSGKVKLITDLLGEFELGPGEQYTLWPGLKHQFEGMEDSLAVEVEWIQNTKYDENDIVRESTGFLKNSCWR